MKNLLTSDIGIGKRYSFEKKSIDFLYKSNKEMVNELAKSIVGGVDGTSQYVLYGLDKTLISGNDYSFTKGAIYDSATDEVYLVDAVASLEILIDPVMTIATTFPGAYNPIKFSDLVNYEPHQEKKVTISDGVLGTANFNFEDLVFIQKPWKTYNAVNGDMSTTIGDWTIGGGSGTITYWVRNGSVTINIFFDGTNVPVGFSSVPVFIFALPSEIPKPLVVGFGSGRFVNTSQPGGGAGGNGKSGVEVIAELNGDLKFDPDVHVNMDGGSGSDNIVVTGSITYPHI